MTDKMKLTVEEAITNSDDPILKQVMEELGESFRKMEVYGPLPDGSGFAVASMPLPDGHWLLAEGANVPPMPMRMGTDDPSRAEMEKMLWAAGKYAIRCATMNGREMDFDPDALLQALVVGMLGYYTPDGLSNL